MIPPPGEATERSLVDAKWQAYGPASFADLRRQAGGQPGNEAIAGFAAILRAVSQGDAPEVNKSVRKYHTTLENMPLADVKLSKAAAESWLNKFNPTAQGVLLYLVAIGMAFTSFLVRWDGMRRATFWLLVGVFVIHTIALISRIYISGRAPVINLYSSAVFIGWACVLLCLVLERIYPIGIANLVAAQIGVATIAVARFLDTSDTLPVLQAVLDTQFWLSTHVITITAGYAVTFAAGFIGIAALVHRMATGYDAYPAGQRPKQSEAFQQILYRMGYGVVCFALFFSFIGTVLGGLWADDSWGRFWGWDPKENGAMLIVLWNAILLHARWDKQVGPRGFAVLAVLGNVVTTWSWFGTNQLGIGLHSYGFTSGALIGLMSFIGVNVLFVIVALVVTRSIAAGAKRAETA
jgi:cytochrome c-type biogenesis protein CcsB